MVRLKKITIADLCMCVGLIYLFMFALDSNSPYVSLHTAISESLLILGFGFYVYAFFKKKKT